MGIINKLKHYSINIISDIKYSKKIELKDSIAADIIRKTHSIEKGLSLKNVRLGFGHAKQEELIKEIEFLESEELNGYYIEAIKMAVSSLNTYINFHNEKEYNDDFMLKLQNFVENHSKYIDSEYGGIKKLDLKELNFEIDKIEKFFLTRHSIRDFSHENINDEELKKAIMLAQTSPSACNRQGYRIYVFEKDTSPEIAKWISGVGGFTEDLNRILIITAKTSSYKENENYQYIVSASIFAAYLSLTLHLYGMGACIIQRPVIWNRTWEKLRKKYNIKEDEQIICMIGVGKLKDGVTVPISHRLDINEIVKFIK